MSERVPVAFDWLNSHFVSALNGTPSLISGRASMAIYWMEGSVRNAEGSETLSLFTEDSPARTSPSQEIVRVWLATDPACGGSFTASLASCGLGGASSRTSLDSCHRTEEGTWVPSSGRWATSGMGTPTECWTLVSSESPSDAAECSLSDILEDEVPPKFFLSQRACAGILRRAEKRGKRLPEPLAAALAAVAGHKTPTE
jgi:hypothetical protein